MSIKVKVKLYSQNFLIKNGKYIVKKIKQIELKFNFHYNEYKTSSNSY